MRWTEVPVDYQDYESEEVELSDVLADNRISDLASYDMELLMDDLKHLDTMSVNLNLAGFDTAAIDALGVSLDSEDTWLGKDFKLEDGMIEETKPMQKVTFFIHTARKKAFMEVVKGFLDTLDVDEYRIVR